MAYADLSYDELLDQYVEVSQLVADLKVGRVYHCGWMSRLDTIREELSSRNNQWMTHVMQRRLNTFPYPFYIVRVDQTSIRMRRSDHTGFTQAELDKLRREEGGFLRPGECIYLRVVLNRV